MSLKQSHVCVLVCVFLVVFAGSGLPLLAQHRARWGREVIRVPNLIPLTRSAGTIFSGSVTSVQRIRAQRIGEVETVQISFRVDHAVQGARAGKRLTIREWAGLWSAGERYRVGERVMLFLYPPSKLGLTSPVGGSQGRFAIDEQGRVLIGGDEDTSNSARSVPVRRGPMKRPVEYREFFHAIRRAAQE